jgi:uncharacterized membrane protein YdbT with pleckstrin-like domain
MAFPRKLLADNEDLVLDLRPHWIALVLPIGAAVLIVGATILAVVNVPDSWPSAIRWLIFLAGLVLFVTYPLRKLVAWFTSHFVVTSDRLIHRSGWLAKSSMEIPLENISDVRFNQSVFERLIGAGDLILESPGTFGQETFSDIRHPERVQKTIYETNEENQRRMMGGRSGSVSDELERLSKLRDQGVLSQAEFDAQKAKLLGSSS